MQINAQAPLFTLFVLSTPQQKAFCFPCFCSAAVNICFLDGK